MCGYKRVWNEINMWIAYPGARLYDKVVDARNALDDEVTECTVFTCFWIPILICFILT